MPLLLIALASLVAAPPPPEDASSLLPFVPFVPREPPIIDAPPAPPPVITIPSPEAVALPPPARRLLEAAIKEGKPETIKSVAAIARQLYPNGIAQVDALVAQHDAEVAEARANAAREKAEALANAALLDNWKGQIEGGASRSTGNTSSLGVYGALNLTKEGLRWRHQLTARADFQRTGDVTTAERFALAWQPNYKFDDRLYAFGLGQYEHDRLLGYSSRYTAGAGIGYAVVSTTRLKVDFEGGPALRYTSYIDEPEKTTVAGRGSVNVKWKLSPTLDFAQNAAIYLEQGNNNAVATTSLDTKLIGALKARFSYNLTYERNAPAERERLDTLTRATLVYSF
jgi:putative salt-induced outer membrane protein